MTGRPRTQVDARLSGCRGTFERASLVVRLAYENVRTLSQAVDDNAARARSKHFTAAVRHDAAATARQMATAAANISTLAMRQADDATAAARTASDLIDDAEDGFDPDGPILAFASPDEAKDAARAMTRDARIVRVRAEKARTAANAAHDVYLHLEGDFIDNPVES